MVNEKSLWRYWEFEAWLVFFFFFAWLLFIGWVVMVSHWLSSCQARRGRWDLLLSWGVRAPPSGLLTLKLHSCIWLSDLIDYSPWDSPSKNTVVGSLCLLQWILPTQESNRGLLHWRRILYQLSYQGSPYFNLDFFLLIFIWLKTQHSKN